MKYVPAYAELITLWAHIPTYKPTLFDSCDGCGVQTRKLNGYLATMAWKTGILWWTRVVYQRTFTVQCDACIKAHQENDAVTLDFTGGIR